MSTTNNPTNNQSIAQPVSGRHPLVNLETYSVTVCGRTIIDYDKLQREEPDLYQKIIERELGSSN